MSEPVVTVLLPVFNGRPFLEQAVRSVLSQTYEALDVLVIDDGSTDSSPEILERLRLEDSRLRFVTRENRGLIATLNEGLALARGSLVARMDADDVCYPDRIARQVEAFRSDPSLGLCATGFDLVFDGDRVEIFTAGERWADEDLPSISLFFTAFRHSTVMFNRPVLGPDVLHYAPECPHAEDFDLFGRITAEHPARLIRDSLLAYRTHEASVTSLHVRTMRRTHLRVVQRNLRAFGCDTEIEALLADPSEPGETLLRQMTRFYEAAREAAAGRPAEERVGLTIGVEGFFFLLLVMAEEEHGPAFAARFLDETGGWAMMRRRERYPLQTFRRSPGLAKAVWEGFRRMDRWERRRRSRPLQRVLAERGLPLEAIAA